MGSADRLIDLFNEAKAKPPPAERSRFIDEACADDFELKQQLISLLRAHDGATDFLQHTPLMSLAVPLNEKPGDRIGRYKLLEQIGEGGCGVVYMAEQAEPVRRRVALKVIKLGMDTKQVVARFESERQALAMMDHPNIAKVFDGGATENGRPYFVMELVRGVAITRFCDEGRLPTRERLRLFILVCQAVQHAHQKGIIHRDLKPSNILITINDGVPVPKVIDFGIAKATGQGLTEKTLFTQFNAFIGTPAYTSPEQAEMSSVDVDTRSDVYSMGVLLYELLTGRTPFNSEELLRSGLDEMRRTIRHEEPTQPSLCLRGLELPEATELSGKRQTQVSALTVALKGDLDSIVMKCLEKDRSHRYETINGLSADIERHLNSEPVTARARSGVYLLQKLARRNKAALITTATIFLLLLAAVLTLAVSNSRIRQERNQKDRALAAARDSEHRAREQLFISLQSQAQARRHSRQPGQRLESLAALGEAARIRPTPELRDNAIAAMAIPDVEQGPTWAVPQPDATDIAFDSTYEHYATLSHDGTISIGAMSANRELQRLKSDPSTRTGSVNGQLAFSPDGRLLARLAETGQLQLWRWKTSDSVLLNSPGKHYAMAFSPDSQRLAVTQGNWLICFNLTTGTESHRWRARDQVYRIEFHPKDDRLAASYYQTNLVSIYNASDGKHLVDLPTGASRTTVIAWHPDGDLLAMAGSDPVIRIWDVNTRREVGVLEGHVQQVIALKFHWSGDVLASMSWDNVLRLSQPLPGRLLMKLPGCAAMGSSPEGRWAGVNQRNTFWGIVPGREYYTFLNTFSESESTLGEGDISADGNLLALATSNGVRLWDIARGRELGRLPIGATTCAIFRDNDRQLLACGPTSGLRRWSLQTNAQPGGPWQLSSAGTIALPFAPIRMARSRDGRTLAIVGERAGECVLLDLDTEALLSPEMPHAMAGYVAITPDGESVATSGWHSDRVKLWDRSSGKLLHELEGCLMSRVYFTPHQELIVAHDREFTFHSLDSLAISRRLPRETGLYPGHVAFTADGKMMALEMAPGLIHLKETTSGRTVAKLEDPHGDVSTWMSFTPDGTQLVVVARYAGAIHRWDLRAIRERLKAMNLDWEWPAFPASKQSQTENRSRPVRVEIMNAKAPPATPLPAIKVSDAQR